jgi:hypothetical protein
MRRTQLLRLEGEKERRRGRTEGGTDHDADSGSEKGEVKSDPVRSRVRFPKGKDGPLASSLSFGPNGREARFAVRRMEPTSALC